ncbi:MAG: hypothetical protein P8H56_04120 [Crocinitomicaceae bacterium]|nr:hypothetical protein [Crocinitomicaceae bacterium]MDG1657749.1 hypothetical protein [Crocinitomicaceae bacterium]
MKSLFNISETDDKVLKVTMSTLIINVDSILSKCESVELFGMLHYLWGHTNGELYFLTEMNDPPWGLYEIVEDILAPRGFKEFDDYVFVFERNMKEWKDKEAVGLNDPIPSCDKTTWISSIMSENGHFVSHKKSESAFKNHENSDVVQSFRFRKSSLDQLVQAINDITRIPEFKNGRGSYINVVRQELNRRGIDFSLIGGPDHLTYLDRVKLVNGKLYPEISKGSFVTMLIWEIRTVFRKTKRVLRERYSTTKV